MEIPKIITIENREYKFIKEYPNYYMYEDTKTKIKAAFKAWDLGLVKEKIKPPKTDVNPEKVKL